MRLISASSGRDRGRSGPQRSPPAPERAGPGAPAREKTGRCRRTRPSRCKGSGRPVARRGSRPRAREVVTSTRRSVPRAVGVSTVTALRHIPGSPRRADVLEALALIVILVLAAWLRLAGVERTSLFGDEAVYSGQAAALAGDAA